MKIEINGLIKKDTIATELNVGTVFIGDAGDGLTDYFVGMIVADLDNNVYVLDLEEGTLYDDVENYYVVRIVNECVLKEL